MHSPAPFRSLITFTLAVAASGLLISGCSQDGGTRGASGGSSKKSTLPAEQRTLEANPGEVRTLQESDVYKLAGTTLFVQNTARGLAVIDVADPDSPVLRHQVSTLTGAAGELYVKGPDLLVVFEESFQAPGSTEIAAVTSAALAPTTVNRLYLSGTLVASRLVGDILYVVTREGSATRIASVDTTNLANLTVADQELLPGEGHEVHVTDQAVYLAQSLPSGTHGTRLRYVDTSDPSGQLVLRGEIDLLGQPQGRFHMDESGTTFRIVTFSGRVEGSNLYVLDVSNPDQLSVRGELLGLAPGEDLRATRFVGDRAYVVTFEPIILTITFFICDPLWVIDLSDPAAPTVLGELEVPGWSDYVFPRGDRLVAVGRGGAEGEVVAVSLFDVADPTHPTELRRLEFGVPTTATSEANSDFHGVTIVEKGALGAEAMVAVPYTNNLHDAQGVCAPEHFVQLFDLRDDDLILRGKVRQIGLVQRTLPVGTKLYAITEKSVAVVDVTDRDAPRIATSLEVGDIAAVETCSEVFVPAPTTVFNLAGSCSLSSHRADSPLGPAFLLLILGLAVGRSRAR
jgi:hypothetical protein